MEKVKIDFGKSYEKQSKKAKLMLCKHDFYEIKNLLIFKNNLKKELTNKQKYGIIVIERKRGNNYDSILFI